MVTIVFLAAPSRQDARQVERLPQAQLDRFRRNLRQLRRGAGLSQEALAEKARVSPRYLQSIEAGAFGCSFAVLVRLRRALDVSWDVLLAGVK